MDRPPEWLRVEAVLPTEPDAELARLHAGERDAIRLATQLKADLILLDEKAARAMAIQRGLAVTGLLGVLDQGATHGLLDVPAAIERLKRTTFRAAPSLLD